MGIMSLVNNISKIQCLAIVILMSVLATGCERYQIKSAKEVAGEYGFRHNNGEIEVIILKEDVTFVQEMYHDYASYQMHTNPEFHFLGTWSYKINRLDFDGMFAFCKNSDPAQRLAAPVRVLGIFGRWVPPSSSSDAIIWIFEDAGYGFLRTSGIGDNH